MRRGWRAPYAGVQRTPVEMRFVDMFMTALGSLIFVALLLVFVVVNFPTGGLAPLQQETGPPAGELRLLTKQLQPARAGESYEAALAYRGGAGTVRWSLTQSETGLPPGMTFDPAEGVLSGVAGRAGAYRFTVTVTDQENVAVTRGYDLEVAPAQVQSKRFNLWVAGVLAVILFLAMLLFLGQAAYGAMIARNARATFAAGRPTYEFGPRSNLTIVEPDGVALYDTMAASGRTLAILCLLGFLATVAYIAWVLWLS